MPNMGRDVFRQLPPDVTELVHDPSSFKCFPYSSRKWTFGMEVKERKVVVSSKQKPLNLVLWLYALKEKKNILKYVAKAVSY